MLAYALRRALAGLSVLLGITVVVFLMLRFIPGDPATAVLLTMVEPGLDSAQITQRDIDEVRDQMGLNAPLPQQYVTWLGRVVTGNLGTSLRSRQPIADELAARIPATLKLGGAALLVMFVIAIPSGILGGLYAGRTTDHVTRVLSLVGESLPSFFLGVLLVYLFAITLGWLPAMGGRRPESIILPAVTLGVAIAAATSRLLRASLLDTLSQPYMLMAEAKGMKRRTLLFRHALRPALIPVLTAASLVAGGLLGGTAVIETVFAWPGVGRYMVEAISGRDYPVIQGFTLLMATLFVIINFAVDILYRFMDPRVRVEERGDVDRVLHRFASGLRRDPVGILLLTIVIAMVAAVLAAPLISGLSPVNTDFKQVLVPPNAVNLLGTDDFGRDVFTRLLYGGRTSLMVAAIAVLIVMSIGVTVGIVAGYFGGVVDLVLTKIIDVLLAFPRLVLAIAVAALMGGGMLPLIIAISVVAWPAYARIIRGFTLQLAQEGYVSAARCLGTPAWKILTGHIALNLTGPIFVLAMLDIGNLILAVSALSFLGLGVPPPAPEWGAMLNEGRGSMEIAPWLVLAPGVAIFVVVLAANYFGDIVRDSVEGRPVHGPRNWLRLPRWGASRPLRTNAIVASCEAPPASASSALDLQAVRVEVVDRRSPYFGRRILNDVSLRVGRGESIGLIGESGSGKSTLAALALGLTRPPLGLVGGHASLFGQDTTSWSWDDWQQVRGRMATLVNQDPLAALNPVLRIGDQIREVMQVHFAPSAAAIEHRLGEVLDEVQLPTRVLRQFPHELSGGMRQRAVIAMAVVNRPKLLIADEPTTALDVSTQLRILDLLRDLQIRYGLALVFVSHDLRVVSRVVDRAVILRNGTVMDSGPTAMVFGNATHPYTRELLTAIPGRRLRSAPLGEG